MARVERAMRAVRRQVAVVRMWDYAKAKWLW